MLATSLGKTGKVRGVREVLSLDAHGERLGSHVDFALHEVQGGATAHREKDSAANVSAVAFSP